MMEVEPTTWETEGTLFVVEIYFEPNQPDFDETRYADDYRKALELSQTYGGAIVVIEGHSDPLGVLRARKQGKSLTFVSQMEQAAKNLSLSRANAVRDSYLNFCKNAGMVIDDSQFTPVGMGVKAPKFNPPRTKEEWAANRRVVFRIKQVEAELDEFVPLD
jgi:outer membrane protein OmpA-like peptidoglycan-associated protein